MKKIIIYTALLLAGVILHPSCQRAGMDDPQPEESFRLRVGVEGVRTGLTVETRSTVEAVEGEESVANLRLFFFKQSNGVFVQDYLIVSPTVGSLMDIEIGAGAGAKLSNSLDYSILAVANMDDLMDAGFISGLEGKTESDVVGELLRLNAASPVKFLQSKLPMSGKCVKKAGQQLTELALSRAVSRFDIHNYVSDKYDLVSASIYNAATKSPIWGEGGMAEDQVCTAGKYYGKMCEASETAITGGLYAFENFIADPDGNSAGATSLVIGLKPKPGEPGDPPTETAYYRVCVHPGGEAQNLKRNHVYKITVNAVLKDGAASEDEAVNGGLDVSINNWDIDEEGMVVSDGDNILAIPSKVIRFGPAAASRVYDIFTHGEGTLSIATQDLPKGIEAELKDGKLKVTVTRLPGDGERRGTIEIGFGTLRGRIEVIQSPEDDHYLILTPGTVPIFGPSGNTHGETVTVSASGRWQAKIFNTTGTAGFSFAPGGVPVLEYGTDGGDGTFDVYTLGDNPKRDILRGFIIASLVDNPEYKQVVILSQESKLQIRISPDYSGFHFTVTGSPVNRSEDHFPIEVTPGIDKTSGEARPWRAVLEGDNAVYFDLVTDQANPTRLKLIAKGTDKNYPGVNLSGEELSDVNVRIEHIDVDEPAEGVDCILLPVKQDKLELILDLVPCSLRKVPVEGSERDGVYQDYVEYEVRLDPRLKWKAKITQTYEKDKDKPWLVHDGFFIDRSKKALKGQAELPAVSTTDENRIRIGFDKVYYPLINVSPNVEVTVSIEGQPFSTTITVEQERLLPRPVKIQSYNAGYGSLWTRLDGVVGYYIGDYGKYIANDNLFGPGNTSMVKTDAKITRGKVYIQTNGIESGVTYVQFNSEYVINDNDIVSIRKWHEANERNLLVTAHENTTHSVKLKAMLDSYAAKRGYSYKGDGDMGTDIERDGYLCKESYEAKKRAMLFILQDGPATRGRIINSWDGIKLESSDLINSGLTEWPAYAVPILQFGKGSRPIPHMSVVIDPMDNIIFFGEMQHFHVSPGTPPKLDDKTWESSSLFLANLTAYVVNASQYGSHFTDMFIQLKPGDKGYDEKAEAERAKRYENAKKYWQKYTPETW